MRHRREQIAVLTESAEQIATSAYEDARSERGWACERASSSTLVMGSDEAKELLNDDLTGLSSATDESGQGLIEDNRDLVKVVVESVDVVQQVQDRENARDRGALGQEVGDAREQVRVLTQ